MKVLVSPQTERGHAVGAYRLYWPAETLRDQGHDVTICGPTFNEPKAKVLDAATLDARDFDVLVIQRPRRQADLHAMRILQKTGTAVVVDIDDDLHAIHPQNMARFPASMAMEQVQVGYDPLALAPMGADTRGVRLKSPDYGPGWVAKCCRQADLVTVSTPALAEVYAKHGRFAILPNRVPARYLDVQVRRKSGVTVGWSGSMNVHPDDLQVTAGGVGRAIRETGARFHVVGNARGVKDALGLDVEPSTTKLDWVPLADYPAQVAKLDVGIVPLAPGRFNDAKSALKMSEMAALGVVPLVTLTPDNARMVIAGVGLPADDWYLHLKDLIVDPVLLDAYATRGREVMRRHTIEGNAHQWLEAWAWGHEHRQKEAAA